jgi:hypothetical protein
MRLLIEDVHVTGSHVQIRLRIPLDPPDPGPRPGHPQPKTTGPRSVSSKTVCVPFVVTDGQSFRLALSAKLNPTLMHLHAQWVGLLTAPVGEDAGPA